MNASSSTPLSLRFTRPSRTRINFTLSWSTAQEVNSTTFQPSNKNSQKSSTSLTISRAKFYISQIILALDYMHSRDIVYRDLKPQNIMLDKKGYVKLTDFGLSKKIKRGQENVFSISGMPQYTAPQILFQHQCSKAVDFWCLGYLLPLIQLTSARNGYRLPTFLLLKSQ